MYLLDQTMVGRFKMCKWMVLGFSFCLISLTLLLDVRCFCFLSFKNMNTGSMHVTLAAYLHFQLFMFVCYTSS